MSSAAVMIRVIRILNLMSKHSDTLYIFVFCAYSLLVTGLLQIISIWNVFYPFNTEQNCIRKHSIFEKLFFRKNKMWHFI